MQGRAQEVLAFVRQHGRTHPKDVQAHFDHGRIKRWPEVRHLQEHAKSRYAHAQVDGRLWFWPQGEKLVAAGHLVDDRLCRPTSAAWAITRSRCHGATVSATDGGKPQAERNGFVIRRSRFKVPGPAPSSGTTSTHD
jgi:hypothetical protein